MICLGIETSCDESALALYGPEGLLGHVLYSQASIHMKYGGVVPEIAAREHVLKLDELLDQLLSDTAISLEQITHIAYTRGPGLIGALLVGANYASGLALGLGIPILGVNHLEAHLVSPFMNQTFPTEPFLTLLLSGGHTQIILTKEFGTYEVIGETLDDAIGEAFDKTAKIMGLGYPGGPEIERLAKLATEPITLPRPMKREKSAMMSFSGLKTATRQAYEQQSTTAGIKENIAAGLQEAMGDMLVQKLNAAISSTGIDTVVVSGGVSANQYLRTRIQNSLAKTTTCPDLEFCTDNAAMVAYLGTLRHNQFVDTFPMPSVLPRWPLASLEG